MSAASAAISATLGSVPPSQWMLPIALVTAFAWQGCGGASRQPEPPPYTPVNSPEAESPCPAQWQGAKAAREALVGETSSSSLLAAARAVWSQAECERSLLLEAKAPRGTQSEVIEGLRAYRHTMENTVNLYTEVARYGQPGHAEALGRVAELKLAFAHFLTGTPAPEDLRDPAERVDFMTELHTLSKSFAAEAAQTFDAALTSAATDSSATREWARAICDELARLNTLAWEGQPLCVATESAPASRGNE